MTWYISIGLNIYLNGFDFKQKYLSNTNTQRNEIELKCNHLNIKPTLGKKFLWKYLHHYNP